MPIDLLEKIAIEAEQLSVDEQLELAALLIARVRQVQKSPVGQPERQLKWRDIRGLFPYPMVGEDAQHWVLRTRREGDEQREQQWRREE